MIPAKKAVIEEPTLPLELDLPEETQPVTTLPPVDMPGNPVQAAYAMASSERRPMPDGQGGTVVYGAANALSEDDTAAWVEGVDGDGVGEWLRVFLPQPTRLTGLRIKNGYWKSEQHLLKNTRAARVRVSFSDGDTEEFVLFDPQERAPGVLRTDGEEITFARPHVSDYLQVTILAVYRGGAEEYDTCITQLVPLG